MPTDQDIADLCYGIYAYPGVAPVAWDHYEPGVGTAGVCFGVKYAADADIVIFRGTADVAEWFDDFDFVAAPAVDAKLGDVHAGFLVGMPEAWATIKKTRRTNFPLWIGGHSLGAARADVCCGLACLDNDPPQGRVVFGEPYPGFKSFCNLLAVEIDWQSSYCNGDANGHDLICNVPFVLPPRFPYARPTPLITISQSPLSADQWGAFRYHHAQLYQAAPGKRTWKAH